MKSPIFILHVNGIRSGYYSNRLKLYEAIVNHPRIKYTRGYRESYRKFCLRAKEAKRECFGLLAFSYKLEWKTTNIIVDAFSKTMPDDGIRRYIWRVEIIQPNDLNTNLS